MQYIELRDSSIVLVDDEDYESLLSFGSWYITNQGYATICYKGILLAMHRVILEWELGDSIPEGLVVDHINRNKLDNRRENLRLVTRSENSYNSGMRKNNTSGYKGVDYHNNRNQYRARFGTKHLGWFNTKEEAIAAREKAEQDF